MTKNHMIFTIDGVLVDAGDDINECVMTGVTAVLLAGDIVVVKPVEPE